MHSLDGMTEQTLLDEHGILVTDRRVVVGEGEYDIADVLSSEASPRIPDRAVGIVFVALGPIAGTVLFLCWLAEVDMVLWPCLGFPVTIAAVATILLWRKNHVVILKTSSGRSEILEDQDGAFMTRVSDAVNRAIALRAPSSV